MMKMTSAMAEVIFIWCKKFTGIDFRNHRIHPTKMENNEMSICICNSSICSKKFLFIY